MKKFDLCTAVAVAALITALAACLFCWRGRVCAAAPAGENTAKKAAAANLPEFPDGVIRAQGYFRGRSMVTLKNKYAGFVSKVHIYSGKPVKKGDVILEYDDWAWRRDVEAKRNKIIELEKQLEIAKNDLAIVKLNPLPSDFRNITWKISSSKEQLDRARNELEVYKRLFRAKAVADLDLRTKQQTFADALATYESRVSDRKKVLQGMEKFYIASAEKEVALKESQLAAAKREFELLLEEGKYYKITAPRDGIVDTKSDTVAAYNAAGTSAASVHSGGDRRRVYAYFEEKYLPYLTEGDTARYRCNHTGEYLELKMFEVDRSRQNHGEKTFYTVKFDVVSPATHIRLESNGVVEYPVKKR